MTASLTSVNQLDHVVFNFDPGPKRVPILYSTAIQIKTMEVKSCHCTHPCLYFYNFNLSKKIKNAGLNYMSLDYIL